MPDLVIYGRVVGRFELGKSREESTCEAARAVAGAFAFFDPVWWKLEKPGVRGTIVRELEPWQRLVLLCRVAARLVNAYHGGRPDTTDEFELLARVIETKDGALYGALGMAWLLRLAAPEMSAAMDLDGSRRFTFQPPGVDRTEEGPAIPFSDIADCATMNAWYEADATACARAAVDTFEAYAELWAEQADPSFTRKPVRLLLAIVAGVSNELCFRHPSMPLEAVRSDVVGQIAALYGPLLPNLVGPAELETFNGGKHDAEA